MMPATAATLKQLRESDWFGQVGEPIFDQRVRALKSWKQAIAECTSARWSDLQLEMANRLREKLLSRSKERFRKWNEVVREIRPITNELVAEKCAAVVKANNLPKEFLDSVRWDILSVALEAEYSDIVPVSFYAGNAHWYASGHFPCGWDGIPLEKGGHLIVF